MPTRALPFAQLLAALTLALTAQSSAQAADYPMDRSLDPGVTDGCAEQVSAPPAQSHPAPDARKILPPQSGLYFGLYQIPTNPAEIERFAAATGRFPPIVFSFHDLFAETNYGTTPDLEITSPMEGDDSLSPIALGDYLAERGSVLALAWAVYCCDINSTLFWSRLKSPHDHFNRILRGEHDDFLRKSARIIRDWGKPIMLTVAPEFNWQSSFMFGADGRSWMDAVDNICSEYGDPTWPDGPERIRDVFIHVIDLFRAEGVKNVTWMMYAGTQYMAEGTDDQSKWLHPKYAYPGDDYIDWVGQSVYFTQADWVDRYDYMGTFEQAYRPGYDAWRSVTSHPQMIPEFGLTAKESDDRRALWRNTLLEIQSSMPLLKAVTVGDSDVFLEYFDLPRLTDSPEDQTVVKEVLAKESYFTNALRIGRPH